MGEVITASVRRIAVVVCLLGLFGVSSSAWAQRGALSLDKRGFAVTDDTDSLSLGNEAMTVEAWIKHDGTSDADAVILTKRDGTTVDYELSLAGEGEEVPVRFYFYSQSYYAESSVGIPANQWTHVAGTWDGTDLNVYVNGELSGTRSSSGESNAVDTPLMIGTATAAGTRLFSGQIDEVRIWETVRMSSEIEGSMFASLTGTEDNLMAYYPFSSEGEDAAGTHDLELRGSAQIVTPGVLPVAPELFATVGQTEVRLQWNERLGEGGANQASQFKIYRSTQADASDRQLVATVPAGTTGYADTGLTAGTTYFYEITSVDAAGQESDFSYRLPARPYTTQGGGALDLRNGGFALASHRPALSLGNEAITVEAWIKHDGTSDADAVILTKRDGTTVDYELSLAGEGEEVPVRFYFYSQSYYAESSVGIPANQWTHVAGTWDGTTLAVYVNGELSGTRSSSGESNAVETPLLVGAATTAGGRQFSGLIDEVRIWDIVRPSFDLEENVLDILQGNEEGLRAYFQFDAIGADAPTGHMPTGLGTLTLQGNADVVATGAMPATPLLTARMEGEAAVLTWEARSEEGAHGYRLYRSTQPGGSDRQVVNSFYQANNEPFPGGTYTDTGLTAGTTYFYELTTFNAAGQESDFSAAASITAAASRDGNALDLTNGGFALASHRPALSLGNEAITVEAWIKHDGTSDADAVILTKRDGTTVDYELSLAGEGEEVPVRFYFYSQSYYAESSVGIPANQWTHVAGTWDGTTLAVYVNGELSGTRSSSGESNAVETPLLVGAATTAGGRQFSGLIDEVRIWGIVRPSFDLEENVLDVLQGDEEGLRAYFRFDESEGTIARGSTPNPMTLQLMGNATFTAAGSPVDVEDGGTALPEAFTLDGNYPNPFNPQTTIRYGLAKAGAVHVTVYNALGQQVAVLVNGAVQAAGWHEVAFEAGHLPSGTYLYRVEADGLSKVGRMLLVK